MSTSAISDRQPPPRDRLAYPYSEAGEKLGISAKSVYNLVRAGSLKVVKIGAAVRIPHSELEKFVAERTVTALA